MREEWLVSRRRLLAATVAVTAGVAGCNNDPEQTDEPAGTPTDTPTSTPTETPPGTTPTATETPGDTPTDTPEDTPTETPEEPPESTPIGGKPSLSEFDYPDGTSQSGVDDAVALMSTQRSLIKDYDSFTTTNKFVRDRSDFDSPDYELETVAKTEGVGYFREVDNRDGSVVENQWAPADDPIGPDHVTFVQAFQGPYQSYRMDQGQLEHEDLWQESSFSQPLINLEWGEAQEVVPVDDTWGVTYESTGIKDASVVGPHSELNEFRAEMTVVQIAVPENSEFGEPPEGFTAGYVAEVSVTIDKVENGVEIHRERDSTLGELGSTDVEAPDWYDRCREFGYYFRNPERIDNNEAYRIEMANGPALPTDATVELSDKNGYGKAAPPTEATVGDRLFVGFTPEGEVRVGVNDVPEGTRTLDDNVYIDMDVDGPVVFNHEEE